MPKNEALERMERGMRLKAALPEAYRAEVERMLERAPRRSALRSAEEAERAILEDALERTLPRTDFELADLAKTDRRRYDAIHALERAGDVSWLSLAEMPGELGWAAVRSPPVPKEDWPKTFTEWLALKPEEREELVRCPGFDPRALTRPPRRPQLPASPKEGV